MADSPFARAAAKLSEGDAPKGLDLAGLAKILDPKTVQTPALDLIDAELQRLIDTPDGRLILVCPPQEGKSTRAAKVFPTALLRHRPDTRIIVASYGQRLARRNGRAIRDSIESHPEFGLKVRGDLAAQDEWQLEGHEGGVYAASVGGSATGRPCDFLLIDDPVRDRADADSVTMQENTWDWWTDAASTRLAPGAQVCLIMTRWNERDLAGRLLKSDDGDLWRVVRIPAQADHDPEAGETDALGREPGEWLESARGRTPEQWEAIKARVGSRTWQALYQGTPSPAEGGLFKRDAWKRYLAPLWIEYDTGVRWVPGDGIEMIQSWDLTFKDTTRSDYVVGQVWMRRGTDAFLLDQVRARMSFTDSCNAITAMSARWPQANAKLIEEKANGAAVMEYLHKTILGLIPVQPKESKQARAAAITPFVEAGNVWIPAPEVCPWVEELVEEAAGFPLGAHDDQCDALSQALNHLMNNPWRNFDEIFEAEEFTLADTGWPGISRY